jgi:hypothetical protein
LPLGFLNNGWDVSILFDGLYPLAHIEAAIKEAFGDKRILDNLYVTLIGARGNRKDGRRTLLSNGKTGPSKRGPIKTSQTRDPRYQEVKTAYNEVYVQLIGENGHLRNLT